MELVRAHRLVTLTGVGGVGKTRLGLQVAAELTGEFPDGVWLIELAPVVDPGAVPDAVATALGVTTPVGNSMAASVAQALSGRRLLVVLDNCEHVLDETAELVEAILAGTSTVHVLATSREGLRAGGGTVVAGAVTRCPGRGDVGSSGVVRRTGQGREPGVRSARCRHDGCGGGHLLEVGWHRLGHRVGGGSDGCHEPAGSAGPPGRPLPAFVGSRRGLERHQTLRQAVSWSYDLLDDNERILLTHCSVFAGGFDARRPPSCRRGRTSTPCSTGLRGQAPGARRPAIQPNLPDQAGSRGLLAPCADGSGPGLQGTWVDPLAGNMAFGEYARLWLKQRVNLRPRTAELYDYLLRRHLLPSLALVQLKSITSARVRVLHAELSAKPTIGASTVSKCYRLLSTILATAVEDELIPKNPCVLKGVGVEQHDERPVARVAQLEALADAMEPRYRAMILLAAWCGLRYGELGGLARADIDLVQRTVGVRRQLQELVDGRQIFGPPKTAAGVRTVAIPPHVVGAIARHLQHHVRPEAEALVFTAPTGTFCAAATSTAGPGSRPVPPWAWSAFGFMISAIPATPWRRPPAPAPRSS